ncbi:MAG: exodeoxyribonuclease VII large subunit [SAR324 cluster bacterium]|nr:exodeoxyribonuclease VII large subunit [SAR324 cluster bacterium]
MSSIIFEVDAPSTKDDSEVSKSSQSQASSIPDNEIWTVSRLTRHIRLVLEDKFRSLVLEGELSNFKRSSPGHLYFQLKDDQAQIRGIMFRQAARLLKFEPSDGLEVIVKGHIAVYEPRGEYQLQISSMEPKGLGSLQLAYEQLKEKLQREGLFSAQHKKAIPFLPRRIGIVTSSSGAVIHDMMNVLNRRCPIVPVLFFPAAVQGEQAPGSLIESIEYLNSLQESHQIDLIIIGRGGGSIEDLWAFNDENLARAIFNSIIPIISAVGHETDFTIADFVSDLRAPTPSAAMELAIPPLQELERNLEQQENRLYRLIKQQLQQQHEKISRTLQRLRKPDFIVHQHMQRLDDLSTRLNQQISYHRKIEDQNYKRLAERLVLLNPMKTLEVCQNDVDRLTKRLTQIIESNLESNKEKLNQRLELLDSLSPLTIMTRGYGSITNSSKQPVKSIDSVEIGDPLSVRLADGTLETFIKDKFPQHDDDELI